MGTGTGATPAVRRRKTQGVHLVASTNGHDTDDRPGDALHNWLAKISIFVLVVVLAGLAVGVLTENHRIHDANKKQDERIAKLLDAQTREIQADCPFKLQMFLLPNVARVQSQVLWDISDSAKDAYVGKNCATAISPRTHKPFGPLPRMRVKRDLKKFPITQ